MSANQKAGQNKAQQYRSKLLNAVASQQRTIEAQKAELVELRGVVADLVKAAGIGSHPRFASLVKRAEDEKPDTTTEEAKKPLATDDPESKGSTGGDANDGVTPAAVTDVQSTDVALTDNAELTHLEDVTKPTPGTDAVDPNAVFNGDVQVGTPSNETFEKPSDSGWTGSPGSTNRQSSLNERGDDVSRFTASLRLARLQIAAGIGSGEDLALAQSIQDSNQTLAEINSSAATLQQVVTTASRNRPTERHRHLVPQTASGARQTPSLATTASGLPSVTSSARDEDEWAFGSVEN